MATSGICKKDGDKKAAGFTLWPVEYVPQTKEFQCGWCGQALLLDRNHENIETHFESCINPKENGLLLVFQELQKITQKYETLNAAMSEMQKKVDKIETEVTVETESKLRLVARKTIKVKKEVESNKTEVNKEISDLKLDVKKILDTSLPSLLRKINVLEETKTQLEQEVAKLKTGTETLAEQVQSNSQDLQVLKKQMEDERAKNELAENKKSFHVEPSAFDQLTIPMNSFNLCTRNSLFQPSFRWTIDGIEAKMSRDKLELSSEMFQWNGYPVHARAKLRVKKDAGVWISLCLEDKDSLENIRPIPRVFYLLKDQMNAKTECFSVAHLFSATFQQSLPFNDFFNRNCWLNQSAYKVNDALEMEIYVEPWLMAQQVHSYDGALEWNMENYRRRLQLEKEGLVYCQESPYFYTGPKGYRVQVKMLLNGVKGGDGGPSAEMLFLTGQFDADLSESFPHSTTVTLVNRKEPERSISKTVVRDIGKKMYEFEICRLEDVENLIENDTLFCKVTIESQLQTI